METARPQMCYRRESTVLDTLTGISCAITGCLVCVSFVIFKKFGLTLRLIMILNKFHIQQDPTLIEVDLRSWGTNEFFKVLSYTKLFRFKQN